MIGAIASAQVVEKSVISTVSQTEGLAMSVRHLNIRPVT